MAVGLKTWAIEVYYIEQAAFFCDEVSQIKHLGKMTAIKKSFRGRLPKILHFHSLCGLNFEGSKHICSHNFTTCPNCAKQEEED
jgi:hypothetical protein